jgi:hypothetical protein
MFGINIPGRVGAGGAGLRDVDEGEEVEGDEEGDEDLDFVPRVVI